MDVKAFTLFEAYEFATVAHEGQARKYTGQPKKCKKVAFL